MSARWDDAPSAADAWARVDEILARPVVEPVRGQLAAIDLEVAEPQQLGLFDPEVDR
jgi:hypothetical protein